MNYDVIATPRFALDIKKLAKKYHSIKTEYTQLVDSLMHNPTQGTSLGSDCYKIRVPIASKGKGKSG